MPGAPGFGPGTEKPKTTNSRRFMPLPRWATKAASTAAAAAFPDFLPEDKAICERGQLGATGDFTPGQLVPMERVVEDFHRYLDWRLNSTEPAPVHTEAQA